MEKWVGIFGVPVKILSDNGLEFQNEELQNNDGPIQYKDFKYTCWVRRVMGYVRGWCDSQLF